MNDKWLEWIVALMGIFSAATAVFAVAAWLTTGNVVSGLYAIPLVYLAGVCLMSSETRRLLRRLRRRRMLRQRPLVYSLTIGVEPVKVSKDPDEIITFVRMLVPAITNLIRESGVDFSRAMQAQKEAWNAVDDWARRVKSEPWRELNVKERHDHRYELPIVVDLFGGMIWLVAVEDVE